VGIAWLASLTGAGALGACDDFDPPARPQSPAPTMMRDAATTMRDAASGPDARPRADGAAPDALDAGAD
jgi:hypothetical protein